VKGPAIFLLSLVAAAGFAAAAILPAWRRGSELEAELANRPAEADAALEKSARTAGSRLGRLLDASGRPALDRLRSIALGYAPISEIREDRDAGEISLVVPWSSLPRLLVRLASDRRLALALVEVTETGQPERGRLRIRLEPAIPGS
jgi:hypothetical protein